MTCCGIGVGFGTNMEACSATRCPAEPTLVCVPRVGNLLDVRAPAWASARFLHTLAAAAPAVSCVPVLGRKTPRRLCFTAEAQPTNMLQYTLTSCHTSVPGTGDTNTDTTGGAALQVPGPRGDQVLKKHAFCVPWV